MSLDSILNYFPRYLNEEERANPFLVLEDFFSKYTVEESRALLKLWLSMLSSGQFSRLGRAERREFLVFFEDLEKLFEAAHFLEIRMGKWKEIRLN